MNNETNTNTNTEAATAEGELRITPEMLPVLFGEMADQALADGCSVADVIASLEIAKLTVFLQVRERTRARIITPHT